MTDEGTAMNGRLYSVAEVALALAVHPETVRRLVRKGALPATRIGRSLRVEPLAVRELIASGRVRPRAGKAQAEAGLAGV